MTADAPGSYEWRWADIGGQQHKLRFEELAQALSRGRLPPYTLVWRSGWLEWLPAANVPDLSAAIGVRRAAAPILARTDPGALAPPTPPLAHYATSVPKGTLTIERGEAQAAASPRAPVRTQKGIPAPSDPPPVVGPPVPLRNVMPTLSEDGQPTRSNTLRPTGAIPPPPRNVPAPKRPPFSSIPPVGARSGVPPPPHPPVPAPPPAKSPAPSNGARAAARGTSSAPPPPSSRRKAAAQAAAAASSAAQARAAVPKSPPEPKKIVERTPAVAAAAVPQSPPEPKKIDERAPAVAANAQNDETATRVAEAKPPPRAFDAPHLPSVIVTPAPPAHDAAAPSRSEPKPAHAPVPTPAPARAATPSTTPQVTTSAPAPFAPPASPQAMALDTTSSEPAPTSTPVPDPPTPRRHVLASAVASAREPAREAPEDDDVVAKPSLARRWRRSRDDEEVAGLSRRTVTLLSSAGVLIPGVVLLVAALMKPRHKPAEPAVVASVPRATAAAPAPPPGCVVEKPAQRLADSAYLTVPTLVATAPDGVHAALGFAATKEHALGLTIDPATLAANTVFEQTVTGSTTLSVVPLVRSGVLEFVVDRADANLPSARTVDADKRFTIAVTGDAVSRIMGSTTDVVWPRSAQGSAMTTPRVAPIANAGYAIVFREGGQEGNVLIGSVREDGSKSTELSPIKTDAALVGTPAVGTSGDGVLVAFAAKATAADPWHVELAFGKAPDAPRQSHAFTVPAGGPGGEAISPAVEGLGDGRFLLQWTEGSAGNRAVRAQLVTADLVCIGDPVTLSSADQNAGQGTPWIKGTQALALFLVQKEAAHELWAASLRCQ
ncbi:MAG TPA: GYF domain-containing protein [Polyangiaceae bacterium]|nr:GYF domain-containing protein [Polyangiaceae bacterium]